MRKLITRSRARSASEQHLHDEPEKEHEQHRRANAKDGRLVFLESDLGFTGKRISPCQLIRLFLPFDDLFGQVQVCLVKVICSLGRYRVQSSIVAPPLHEVNLDHGPEPYGHLEVILDIDCHLKSLQRLRTFFGMCEGSSIEHVIFDLEPAVFVDSRLLNILQHSRRLPELTLAERCLSETQEEVYASILIWNLWHTLPTAQKHIAALIESALAVVDQAELMNMPKIVGVQLECIPVCLRVVGNAWEFLDQDLLPW
mmetsp:Transcript_135928/g.290500  ORF Transcript_135928/g.290500 Transcript_135928/m.290500 type:complete len:256 (+) Transcript_135928:42-809(+)